MTSNDRPTRWHRYQGRLAASLIVAALATSGCGALATPSGGLSSSSADDPSSLVGGVPSGDHRETPDGTNNPAIANLDPDLLKAVRTAIRDAKADGVELEIVSGWRSREHQQRLLEDAIDKYGSREEALRYVSTPEKSAHVTGQAVDMGPTDGAYWLIQHGAKYGLCQTFVNEIWHFELATSPGGECPDMLPDSSYRH